MARSPHNFDDEKKAAFVLAMERTGEVKAAASSVGVSRQTVYKHLKRDPEFEAACDRARGRLMEKLLDTAKKLAIDGLEETYYDKEGNVTRVVRRYSERVLLAWLKRLAPEAWGDKLQVEQEVRGRVEHEHTGRIEVEKMTPAQRKAARAFLKTIPDAPQPA